MGENNDTRQTFADPQDPVITKLHEMEIQLHLGEYNALTMRCTYFTNIQNMLLSALIIWITVMITLWVSRPNIFIYWGTVFGVQVFGLISTWLLYEEYTIIQYIESDLKPRITNLINHKEFWNYQSFLKTKRTNKYKAWEFIGVMIATSLIIVTALVRIPWDWRDIVGCGINMIILVLFAYRTYYAVKIRWNSWR
jgi:hypothetical protein